MQDYKLPYKIAVIGPESTGKTSLCVALAQHFNAFYTVEYARSFIVQNGNTYYKDDLPIIAKGQQQLELQKIEEMLSERNENSNTLLLFCDTDLHVIRIWSEIVFNECDRKILDMITETPYDLYLLCKPDIPWIYDAQREHPDPQMREKIFHYYLDMLVYQNKPWEVISGNFETRLTTALAVVQKMCDKKVYS